MRSIDADELFKEIATLSVDGSNPMGQGYCAAISDVSNLIIKQPTIEPVKRGKWFVMTTFDNMDRFKDYELECSCCHAIYRAKTFSIIEDWHKYCSRCGAKMDGDD